MSATRSRVKWFVQHGLVRSVLRVAALGGDPVARFSTRPAQRRDPYPFYAWARDRGPIWRGRLATIAPSYAAASEVLRSEAFRVGFDVETVPKPLRWAMFRSDERIVGPVNPPSMVVVNPPDHTRYRRLVAKVFTPRAVAALEPRVQAHADELLDDLDRRAAAGEVVDLATDYAGLLPISVIAEILGVPVSAREDLLRWGHAGAPSLDVGIGYREWVASEQGIHDFNEFMYAHVERLRREPGEGLISQLIAVRDEQGGLSDLEIVATAGLILTAGFETTINLLANGTKVLLDRPDQLALLRGDPALWGNAVEELLRFETPVQMLARTAGADVEVAGVPVRGGGLVMVLIAAANRDPAVFPDPDRFDVTRANARDHLAFSAGIHYCLGASLARVEGRVGLRTLFDRYPDLAAAGEPVPRSVRLLRGYDHLPVSLGRRAAAPDPLPPSATRA